MRHGAVARRLLAVAAGVVFYSLLAIFPAVAAFVSLYGLVADASTIDAHLSLAMKVTNSLANWVDRRSPIPSSPLLLRSPQLRGNRLIVLELLLGPLVDRTQISYRPGVARLAESASAVCVALTQLRQPRRSKAATDCDGPPSLLTLKGAGCSPNEPDRINPE
jgi:hypothetical protein